MRKTIATLILMLGALCGALAQPLQADKGLGATIGKEESPYATSTVRDTVFADFTDDQILNALYGLLPGLQVYQNGAGPWPADNLPNLRVRGTGSYSGNHVLVLVDGIPRDASDVDIAEVESVTVLKDAASLAVYGVRGADGAVLIRTKRGGKAPFRLKAAYRFGMQFPTGIPGMAAPDAYATALNEALANDGKAAAFSAPDIAALGAGTSQVIPTADWEGAMLRRYGFLHDVKLSVDGSTKTTKYYVYANYGSNRGFFRNTGLTEGISTQSEYNSLKLRSNLDIDVTHYTKLQIGLAARLQQVQEPQAGTDLSAMYNAPSAGIPIQWDGKWARTTLYDNPVGSVLGTGNRVNFARMLSGDITLQQRFPFLEGLMAEVKVAYDNSATISDRKSFSYSYLTFTPLYDAAGNIADYALAQYGNDTEIAFGTGLTNQYMRLNTWLRLCWEGTFGGGHHLSTFLAASRDALKLTGAGNSFKHVDFVWNLDYHFRQRYLFALTLSESASSLLPTGDKFRFYPAAAAGWVISNEPFMRNARWIDFLKLRASAGLTGMDANLVYDMDKQFNGAGYSYIFTLPTPLGGAREGDLPSVGVRPETDFKADAGLEFAFPFGLHGEADFFLSRRSGMRTESGNTVSGVLGIGLGDSFTGQMSSRGAELSLSWTRRFGDFAVDLGGNLSYVSTRIDHLEEIYHPDAYQYRTGVNPDRIFGLEWDGFYTAADFDAAGNLLPGVPYSTFAAVQPGDVRYKDLNGDGRIDNYDYTYLKLPTLPELYYGFNAGFSWRGLSLKAFFQGTGDWLAITALPGVYQPLWGGDKNVSDYYLTHYKDASGAYARYPRLTTLDNNNNFRDSDLWTENGRFLKLREVELKYLLPEKATRAMHLGEFAVFVRGNNLLSFDNVKIFDPEYISLGYPRAKSCYVGLSIVF